MKDEFHYRKYMMLVIHGGKLITKDGIKLLDNKFIKALNNNYIAINNLVNLNDTHTSNYVKRQSVKKKIRERIVTMQ